jgi:hypothetical protein
MMRDQAGVLVKTNFLPAAIKTAEQAMAIMLTGRELGIPPMQALRGVNVIQGTPTIKPELMLALCISRIPGFKYSFGKCDSNSATFTVNRPSLAEPYVSTFTMEDAKKAGLTNNPTWSKYPSNMLRWRAVGNALHVACPDVLVGIYTPEEMGAVVDADGGVVEMPAGAQLTGGDEPEYTDAEVVGDGPSPQQVKMMHALAGEVCTETTATGKKEWLKQYKLNVLGHSKTSNDLTKDEMSKLIDSLMADLDKKNAERSEAA